MYSISQNVDIYGYIYNSNTGDKIIGAYIYDSISNECATSNVDGYYSLKLKKNTDALLVISYIGFKSYTQKISIEANSRIDFKLQQGVEIEKVIIRSTKPIEQRLETGVYSLQPQTCKILPSATGESDIFKTLQLVPGVQSGNEGINNLYIRGGGYDQNLVLFDGVALYNTNHLMGFVSICNTNVLNNATIYKSGFPARYGGRLSSIIDIRSKDGNFYSLQGSAHIGIINTSFHIEGPIKKDTSSFCISFRRSPIDIVYTRPLMYFASDGKVVYSLTFYDLLLKYSHKINNRSKITISAFKGHDEMATKIKDEKYSISFKKNIGNSLEWGNQFISIKHLFIINSKTYSTITISASKYEFVYKEWFKGDSVKFNDRFASNISDIQANISLDYSLSKQYNISFGGGIMYHFFNPVIRNVSEYYYGVENNIEFKGYSPQAIEPYVYMEHKILLPYMQTNIGLRYSDYFIENYQFARLEPRILVTIPLAWQTALKASYSQMQQAIHLVASSGTGMPIDYWLPATKTFKPSFSNQYTVSVVKSISQSYEISVETYFKSMKNLLELKNGIQYLGNIDDWQDEVEGNGTGISKGIEFFVEKTTGKHKGWIAYSLSKSNRQFHNLNQGKPFPFKYDKPHAASIVYIYDINKQFSFSSTWVYTTGNAITLAQATYDAVEINDFWENENYDFITTQAEIYGEKNSFRMKDYHRLDVSLKKKVQKKHGIATWSLSIYNAYARPNPYYYYWDKNSLYSFTMFRFLPSISYGFEF